MGLRQWFRAWRTKRSVNKLLKRVPQSPPVSPGVDWGGETFPPTFGFTTNGKPYPGKPDVDLFQTVHRMLLGYSRIKNKTIAEAKIVVTYVGGETQELEKWAGPMRVLISPSGKADYAIIIERSLFYKEPKEEQKENR
jgi:hypothetical protein